LWGGANRQAEMKSPQDKTHLLKGAHVRNLSITRILIRFNEVTANMICLAKLLLFTLHTSRISSKKSHRMKEDIHNVWKGAEFWLHF